MLDFRTKLVFSLVLRIKCNLKHHMHYANNLRPFDELMLNLN